METTIFEWYELFSLREVPFLPRETTSTHDPRPPYPAGSNIMRLCGTTSDSILVLNLGEVNLGEVPDASASQTTSYELLEF